MATWFNPSKNHVRVFDETFEFLANLEPVYDPPVISDREIKFLKIPAYDIKKDIWSYIFILETVMRKSFSIH